MVYRNIVQTHTEQNTVSTSGLRNATSSRERFHITKNRGRMNKGLAAALVVLFMAVGIGGFLLGQQLASSQTRYDLNNPPLLKDVAWKIDFVGASQDALVRSTGGCTTAPPKDVGCTRLCKPCFTYECENKKWVKVRMDNPEACTSTPLPKEPSLCQMSSNSAAAFAACRAKPGCLFCLPPGILPQWQQ
jgi:hypothetical protein